MWPSSTTKSMSRPDVGASFDDGASAAGGVSGASVSVEMYWTATMGRGWPFTSRSKSAAERSVTGRLSLLVTLTSTSTSSARASNWARPAGACTAVDEVGDCARSTRTDPPIAQTTPMTNRQGTALAIRPRIKERIAYGPPGAR